MSILDEYTAGLRSLFFDVSGQVEKADEAMIAALTSRLDGKSRSCLRKIQNGSKSIEIEFSTSVFDHGINYHSPQHVHSQLAETIIPIKNVVQKPEFRWISICNTVNIAMSS